MIEFLEILAQTPPIRMNSQCSCPISGLKSTPQLLMAAKRLLGRVDSAERKIKVDIVAAVFRVGSAPNIIALNSRD